MNNTLRSLLLFGLLCGLSACGGVGYSCLEWEASRPSFRIEANFDAAHGVVRVRPVDIAADVGRSSEAVGPNCVSPSQCLGAQGMELYRSDTGLYGDYLLIDGGDTFELVDRDVEMGRNYEYRMGVVSLVGDEEPSPIVTEISVAVEMVPGP